MAYQNFRFVMNKKRKSPRNIVEATRSAKLVAKISGGAVLEGFIAPDGKVRRRLSLLGLICFSLWVSAYFWCTYVAKSRDETVIRLIYKTKLKGYGDDTELFLMLGIFLYNMWKIPFVFSGNVYFQSVLDIDIALENLGVSIDFSKHSRTVFRLALLQFVVCMLRLSYIIFSTYILGVDLPFHRTFLLIYSNASCLLGMTYYLNYLFILTFRFKLINDLLRGIMCREDRGQIFVSSKAYERSRVVVVREKVVSSKLRACSRIYGLLYEATEEANRTFGIMVLLSVSVAFIMIILNMFYLMEATAASFFRKPELYINFLFHTFWNFCGSVGIIFIVVHFCENATREASKSSSIVHQIMNKESNESTYPEALQFSLQVLHQTPKFTACGVFTLNYGLLLSERGPRPLGTSNLVIPILLYSVGSIPPKQNTYDIML